MEQRKLIRLGNSSFAIALPKTWVKKSGLKKGDNIFVQENSNGDLIVVPEYTSNNLEKKTCLELKEKTRREMNREIIAAYINGNNILDIKLNNKDLSFVKEIINELSGFEIIEEEKEFLLIRDIMDIHTVSLASLIRRMDNTIRSMFEDLEVCIKSRFATQKQYSEVAEADRGVDKSYFLLWKIMLLGLENPSILNSLETTYPSLIYNWSVGEKLEKMGDDLKRVVRILLKNKLSEEETEKIENIFIKIKENFIQSLTSFHKKDKELAFKTTKDKDEIAHLYNKPIDNKVTKEIYEKLMNIHINSHHIAKYVLYFIR